MWWLVAIPGAWFLGWCGVFFLASRTPPTRVLTVAFSGVPRTIALHERHWLPRLLRAWGVAMYPHVYLRGALWPKGQPWDGSTVTCQAWQCGHELWHLWQYRRWGGCVYRVRACVEPLIWWRHNRRPMERDATAHQRAVTEGTSPAVSAPWLADYDNLGMPA